MAVLKQDMDSMLGLGPVGGQRRVTEHNQGDHVVLATKESTRTPNIPQTSSCENLIHQFPLVNWCVSIKGVQANLPINWSHLAISTELLTRC